MRLSFNTFVKTNIYQQWSISKIIFTAFISMLKIRLLHQPAIIFGMLKSGGSKVAVSQNWGFYSTHRPIVAGPLKYQKRPFGPLLAPPEGLRAPAHRDFGSRFFPATISPYLLLIKVSKEAKYFKKHKFLGLVRYFSSWIEKLLKNHKSTQKLTLFEGFSKFIQFWLKSSRSNQ